jgi:F0F1-type ATP synthase membrane subunit b/b'
MDWTKLLYQILNLAIMVFILYRLFSKSALRALDKRSQRVTSTLDDAEQRQSEAIAAYAQLQERLAHMQESVASLKQEAQAELWRTRKHVLAETRHEVEAIRAKAEWGIKEARKKRTYEYQCQLVRLVTTLSERLIREAGGGSFQEACIGQFIERLSRLPSDEIRYSPPAAEEQVVPVQLSSAYVLGVDSAMQLEQQIQERVGRPIRMICKVDPHLVAGVTVRIGDILLDGSVAGTLQNLYERYAAGLEQGTEYRWLPGSHPGRPREPTRLNGPGANQ